jgi:catalase
MEVPAPLPRAMQNPLAPEVTESPALSLTARPGDGGIRTRKIAILVADGVEGESIAALQTALVAEGAVPRLVGIRVGRVVTASGEEIEADASMENSPSVLFDALVLPDGEDAVQQLARDGHTVDFVKDQYRHCKTILAIGASEALLNKAGIPPPSDRDTGLAVTDGADVSAASSWFIEALGMHRHTARDSDPPMV